MAKTPIKDLCTQFDRDIKFDAHGTIIKVGRSRAGKELTERCQEAFSDIVAHLANHPELDQFDLANAWCWLLANIKDGLDPHGELPGYSPTEEKSKPAFEHWLAWARKFVENN